VPDQAPQGQTADPLNDPTIQGIINGTIKLPTPNPLASVPQAGATAPAPGQPVMDPQDYAGMLKFGFKTPALAGAIGPLVTGLGQGLPREGGYQYQTGGPNGTSQLAPIPGAPQAVAAIHGAKATAEEIPKAQAQMWLKEVQTELDNRNTLVDTAVDFHDGRGPVSLKLPRSVALQMGYNAAGAQQPGTTQAGQNAPAGTPEGAGATGTTLAAPNAPTLTGKPVETPQLSGATKYEDNQAEALGKLKDSFTGNQGAIQNLQNFLEAAQGVGTGKGTEFSGHAAAWLKSLGIDPEKLALADPASVEKMRKASTQMIFAGIRGVSNRPAYQEFQMLEKGLPNPDLQPEANRAIAASLLGRMQWENQLYKDWDADRRTSHSAANFDLPAWVAQHPMPAFQASAYTEIPQIPDRQVVGGAQQPQQFQEGQTATGPGGAKVVFRGGHWVPM